LDDALIRPGRIDVRIHFGNATKRQAHELFTKFYPNLEKKSDLPSSFAAKIPEETFSMAHLQGFLMGHKQNPKDAVDLVDNWIESHQKGNADDSTEDKSSTTTVQDL
jgi:chaperone BCS1